MLDIPLKEIMTKPAITVTTDDSLVRVEEKLRVHKIRHLPVVDKNNRVVGMMTHRDLLRCITPHRGEEGYSFDKESLSQFILKHVMTPGPLTLRPDDHLSHAVDIMAREKYGCIPVTTEAGEILGVITQIDILKFLAKKLKE